MKLLKIAALASSTEIANKEPKRMMLKMILRERFPIVTIEYNTKGTLKAMDAAVMFLLPATPLRDIALKLFASNCVIKSP